MSVTLTITGTEELEKALTALAPKVREQGGPALFQEAEAIMADSKDNYCPVDTGVLRNSGHVQAPVDEDGAITVTMGYGGAAKDYAVIQHERLDLRHKVGQAKYLEIPVLSAAANFAERMADRLRGMFA